MEPEKASTRMKTKKTKMLISFKNKFCSSLRASSPRADCEAGRERLGAEVRKGELATITEEISFPLPLREGEYHWLKNDKLSINNH